ncbi:MAG: hypothetical protein QM662_16855 [Gordonia sp. (in: high G+C Gram-positive bacteria)]
MNVVTDLRVPIIAAPMAGGPTTPGLVNLWAGQGYRDVRGGPAAEIIAALWSDA